MTRDLDRQNGELTKMAIRTPQFLKIPFAGTRSGSFPLTWGQAWVWNFAMSRAPYHADLSGSHVIAVPSGCDTSRIADALAAILGRYETLRTRYSIAEDGAPRQIVFAEGTLRVEVRDSDAADAAATAASIEHEFNALPFTHPEVSLRAAVVTADGIPRFVVLCVFNMAVDCHGMVFVLDDFKRLIGGAPADAARPLPDVTTHPVDRVRDEWSTEGLLRSARGVSYWQQELARFPDNTLPYTERRAESPRYKTFAMRSAAVRLATLDLADELRVAPSSVILAMAASLLASRSRNETFGIVIAASHRYDAESMRYPGTLVQGVPAAIDVSGGSPRKLISRTHRVAMLAALAGHCHPDDASAMLRTSYGDAAPEKLACLVNLTLPAPAETLAASRTPVTRSDAERLLEESRYEYLEGTPVASEKLYLAARGDAAHFRIILRADTAVLASADIVQFLRELERSLIDCLPLSC